MKRFQFIGLFFLILLITLCTIPPVSGEAKLLKCEDISRIRLLGPNNNPVKVLVVLTRMTANLPFVEKLVKIVAKIHEQDKLEGKDSFKVLVFPSDDEYFAQLLKKVGNEIAERYIEKGNGYPASDPWMQDWGEVAMVKTRQDSKAQLMILDSNRGQELAALPKLVAKLWNAYYLKNPSKKMLGGDNGGNIEVTPDDILILGNTVSDEFKSFLERRGYRNRIALVETDWLVVGHCDEYLSIAPNDKTKEGFTIIKADPRKALKLLKNVPRAELEALEEGGYKTTLLLVHDTLQGSKIKPDYQKDGLYCKKAINDFIKQNMALGTLIDDNVTRLCDTINKVNHQGSIGHSVMAYPMLFYDYYQGRGANGTKRYLALTPGVVNQLILRKHLVIPDPKIKLFREDIKNVAEKIGLRAHFLDDFMYHKQMGDIHCGTNVFRHPNRYIVKPKNLPDYWEPISTEFR